MALLLLLFLLPILVSCQGNKLAVNYNNKTLSDDIRMQITTTIDGHLNVIYSFNIADKFSVPLLINGQLQTDCNQNLKCYTVVPLGSELSVVINAGSPSNYTFALNQYEAKDLAVFAEGCLQDLSLGCRSVSSPSFFCICSGDGYCTEDVEQKPMFIEPECSDIVTPPTNAPVEDSSYELSVFYGFSDPLSNAVSIKRRVFENQVEYILTQYYYVANIYADGYRCWNFPCYRYLSVGQFLEVSVGSFPYAFTFDLLQVNLTQTDILYQGCSRGISNGACGNDTILGSAEGCLCRGGPPSCTSPAPLSNTCDEITSKTTLSSTTLTTTTSTSTVVTTTASSTTVTTIPTTTSTTTTFSTIPTTTSTTTTFSTSTTTNAYKPWVLYFYYGSNADNNNVTVRRTYIDSLKGQFEITASNQQDVLVNNSRSCDSCNWPLGVHQSLLIQIPGFEFTLVETETDTLVETGPSMCPQDLTQSCRQQVSKNEYRCLCLNTNEFCPKPEAMSTCTTTPTSEPSWVLQLYYGTSRSSFSKSVNISRTDLTDDGAKLDILASNAEDVILNGDQETPNYHCGVHCAPYLYVNNVLVISTPGFKFYLNETKTETVVGLGDKNCPQSFTGGCVGRFYSEDATYRCLCLNTDDRCTSVNDFQDCPTESRTTKLSTTSTTTSTTTKPPTTSKVTQKNGDTTMVTTTEPPTVPSLQNLSDSTIGQNNVTQVLNDTLTYSNNKGDLSTDQIDQISVILSKSANVGGLNETDSLLILANMDNCLYAPYSDVSVNATQNMANVFQPMVQNTNASSISYLNGVNMGFHSKMVDCSSPNSDQGMMDNLTMFVAIDSDPASHLNAIQIPMSSICAQAQSVSHVYFTIYRDRKLFLSPTMTYRTYNNKVFEDNKNGRMAMPESDSSSRSKRDTTVQKKAPSPCDRQTSLAVDSPVMSGSMLADGGSQLISRLATEDTVVNLQFNIEGLLPPLHGKFVVTYWDTNTLTWATTDQCKTEKKGYMVTATCPHLTDFTLIVDGALDDPSICDPTLSTVGYVVNGLSILGLSFLFLVYVCPFIPLVADAKFVQFVNGYAVARRDSISLSYTTSLLLFYIFFTFFASQDVSGNACSTMAAISYSLFIATIVMSIFKCLRTMTKFFPGRTRNWFSFLQRAVVFDTISIITSFLLSLLLLLLTDFFERNDTFCWVRIDLVVFATIIPVSLLVLTATIATGLAAYRLFSTSMRVQRRGRHVNYNLGAKLANILILQFTLGMPWILQYFTLALPKTTAWHYVFTIVLGSQGTVLALLFFYKRQRIWRSSRYARKMASMQTQATMASNSTSSKGT